MIIKILRWLFSPRRAACMKDDRYEHEDDAWRELERRGYAICEHSNGKAYCFTDNGVKASGWFRSDSLEAKRRKIREWSNEELARVLKLESEKRHG